MYYIYFNNLSKVINTKRKISRYRIAVTYKMENTHTTKIPLIKEEMSNSLLLIAHYLKQRANYVKKLFSLISAGIFNTHRLRGTTGN